jgi:hypothetical protein
VSVKIVGRIFGYVARVPLSLQDPEFRERESVANLRTFWIPHREFIATLSGVAIADACRRDSGKLTILPKRCD